ncbi:MAG: YfiR family protein [Methylococcales bacterium]
MKSICSILVLFCLLCSLFLRDSYAESAPVDEYKIKVGYLFNFTKFITWTEETTETFNICILGNDPFGEIIDPIEQRTAFNLPIKLFRLTAMDKAVHCHIVYVGSNVSAKTIAASTKNSLTVGEEPEFISQGGMIAFVKRQDKIKLQINLKLLQQNGLKISAKLLEVVEIVGGDRND